MDFLPRATGWRTAFLAALGLFLVTRALTLMAFPIFNDEAIYLQYSQLIQEDWAKNKFISMNNQYGDWKPPFQFWLGAPLIDRGDDPLLVGRSVAFVVSLFGFFGFYLFAKELFSEREGVVAAVLYVLCPPVLFHNNQFIAETFLFSTAPFVYWSLLNAMQRGKSRWAWAFGALVAGTVLLFFKQSGFLLLAVAIFLPAARLRNGNEKRQGEDHDRTRSWSPKKWRWKEFAANLLIVATVIVGAQLATAALLPAEFNASKERFNHKWVMAPQELLEFPAQAWSGNLQIVCDYIGAYYSWLVPLFIGIFSYRAVREKRLPELALLAMCLAGAFGVTFLLRAFNEYLLNTAVIVTLLPVLARTGVLVWNSAWTGPARLVRRGLQAFAAIMLAYWGYQIVLMGLSPRKYIEQSTPWASMNYLTGWPTGFGVKEVVAILEKEKRPGVIFADAQWGNPRTALEVYGKARFPNLRIVPALGEFSDPTASRRLAERARELAPARYAIFSADPSGQRRRWQSSVERDLCAERTMVESAKGQMPIIVCRF